MPFDYISKDNVKVYFNKQLLTNNMDYIYDSKNSIRIIKDITDTGSVIIRRITPLSHSSSLKELCMVVAELKDNMETISKTFTEMLSSYEKKVSAKLQEHNTQINTYKQELESTTECLKNIRTESEKSDTDLHDVMGKILNSINTLELKMTNLNLLQESALTEAEKKWEEKYNTLQAEYKGITEKYLNAICNLQDKWAETTQSLNMRIDNLSSVKKYAEPIRNRQPIMTNTSDTVINDVVLAINGETQQRRREDAQIKALFKRLLTKYERLEGYIAGENIDITNTVINELRREMRTHDDMLGRTDLENIVRLMRLKNQLPNKGEEKNG